MLLITGAHTAHILLNYSFRAEPRTMKMMHLKLTTKQKLIDIHKGLTCYTMMQNEVDTLTNLNHHYHTVNLHLPNQKEVTKENTTTKDEKDYTRCKLFQILSESPK